MIQYPNAKINLGLNVLRKRDDGYHDIDSVFYPVQWRDILEVIPSNDKDFHFSTSGLTIPGDTNDNLIFKAWKNLSEKYSIGGVKVHLHKIIPMGAGIGGGSADGAFMIKMLNEQFELDLTESAMMEEAGRLGSDCPFFIRNTVSHVTGRGEQMHPIDLDLNKYHFFLIHPGFPIGTAEAYAGIVPNEKAPSTREIVLENGPEEWKDRLKNDFEQSAFAKYPELAVIKQKLYDQGAVYASMTGSGSTLYGIFRTKEEQVSKQFSNSSFTYRWC